MESKNILKSLAVGTLAAFYDQIYHFLLGYPHNIITMLPNATETWWYIGTKFAVSTIVFYITLTNFKLTPMATAISVGSLGALIFSAFMALWFPYAYGFWVHLFHAVAIGFAAFIVEKNKKWFK